MQNFILEKPKTGRNSSYEKFLQLIYDTFNKTSINIVETGTIRNDSESSKYGDGWSTLNLKYYADYTNSKVWSVDINQNHINIAKKVVPADDKLIYVLQDSVDFLKNFTEKIDVLLLDSYDYCGDEENIKKCHNHQLEEVKAALDKLSDNSIILIDDIFDISYNGPGKLSIPFLLSNGFELIHCFDSQVLLQKKNKKEENLYPFVSCVMTTYGRLTCVTNSVGMFLKQDYKGPKELIILNTAEEHPLYLSKELEKYSDIIKIYNSNINKETGLPYTNVGDIRRDAISYTSGELYICWDDDDIFLPYNITQCVEGLLTSGKRAWKPKYSFYWGGGLPEYAENVMEASVIVYIQELKNRGFKPETGSEHCGWYQELVDEGKFHVEKEAIPSYCFNWSRSTGPSDHKQSGDINNPNNFENHKLYSTDFGNGEISKYCEIKLNSIYEKFYELLRKNLKSNKYPEQQNSLLKYTPKELVFISAQPDDLYFVWQIEVQINNFRKYDFSKKMQVLVFYNGNEPNKEWNKLINTYEEVNFYFYKNLGAKINEYIPILRPHILKQHFKIYPELKDKAIFYHDSDIIFTKFIDFTPLLKDNIWYLSDTVSYIGAFYIQSKGEYILENMCDIIGIDKEVVINNQVNSGGAQYLAKNLTFDFWEKVEKDCIGLYTYLNECNVKDLFLREPKTDIQSWCSDMWSVLWNCWYFNMESKVIPEMSFSWATSMLDELNNCSIFHNAGVTPDRKDLFYKGSYINKLPYDLDIEELNKRYASFYYAEAIKEVGKISCLK